MTLGNRFIMRSLTILPLRDICPVVELMQKISLHSTSGEEKKKNAIKCNARTLCICTLGDFSS